MWVCVCYVCGLISLAKGRRTCPQFFIFITTGISLLSPEPEAALYSVTCSYDTPEHMADWLCSKSCPGQNILILTKFSLNNNKTVFFINAHFFFTLERHHCPDALFHLLTLFSGEWFCLVTKYEYRFRYTTCFVVVLWYCYLIVSPWLWLDLIQIREQKKKCKRNYKKGFLYSLCPFLAFALPSSLYYFSM